MKIIDACKGARGGCEIKAGRLQSSYMYMKALSDPFKSIHAYDIYIWLYKQREVRVFVRV